VVTTNVFPVNAGTCTVGSRWNGRSFLNMLMFSRTQFQLCSNAMLSLINEVAISPERAFRLQSAGMMQGV
jgi:hypothetical protein